MKNSLRLSPALMSFPRFRAILLCFVALAIGVGGAKAQTFRGAISGNSYRCVRSDVPSAKVSGTNAGTGVELTTVTSSGGDFSFQDRLHCCFETKSASTRRTCLC